MKWILIFFCIIELISAALQYNDPDAVLWIMLYMIPFFLNLVYLKGRHLRMINIIVLIGYLIFFATHIPALIDWAQKGFPSIVTSMQAATPHVEIVREAGGLLIVIINLILLLRPIRKINNKIV